LNLPELEDFQAKLDTLRQLIAAAMRNLRDEFRYLAGRTTLMPSRGNTLPRRETKFRLKGIAVGRKVRIAYGRILHPAGTLLAPTQPLDSAQ